MRKSRMLYSIYLALSCFIFFSEPSAYAMMEAEEDFTFEAGKSSKPKQERLSASKEGQDKYYTPVQGLRFDLHGESLASAKDMVMNLIPCIYNLNGNEVHFICGRGKHANKNGKRGVIWEAMPTWLNDPSVRPLIHSYKKGLGTYNVILKSPTKDLAESREFPIKIDAIKNLAEAGNAQAQLVLAELYIEGRFIQQNYKTAAVWMRCAADQDLGQALFRLGYMTAMGKGVIYSPTEAIKWYEKAGEKGVSDGYLNIGTIYYVGEGVGQNYETSYRYYIKAAKLKNPRAYNLLGIMTRRGFGVPPSDVMAVLWDRKGAEAGEPHAMVNLGCMLIDGRGVSKNQAEGAEWLKKGAGFGIAEGQLRYGLLCKEGRGIPQDYEQAAMWLRRAITAGFGSIVTDAQFHLYDLIRRDKIKPSKQDEGKELLENAAKGEHSDALFELGHQYRLGLYGFPQDEAKATECYLKASTHNHSGAFYALYEIYSLGQEKDEKKALFYLNKSAQLGYPMALILTNPTSPRAQEIIQELLQSFSEV